MIFTSGPYRQEMLTILSAVISIIALGFRSRAALELKLIALQHQLAVLHRQRPGRPQLSSLDRLLWVWRYRIWPQVIDTMVLVKPATVVDWHRRGFRLYWRWRSRRPGRPRISADIRDLIRRISRANPLWGAPRIHGELLKLGINVSQATVGRWMPWRPKVPSPTWRSFLRNHLPDIAAIDMFVVTTATFRLLYALILLSLDRRQVVHFAVTANPTQDWLARQMTEAFPWDTAPRYLQRDRANRMVCRSAIAFEPWGSRKSSLRTRSPWQNPYAERLIGSIRRECLDHVIIFNERHLSRVLSGYSQYHHNTRTHLSLCKDCPRPRPNNLPRRATSLPSRRLVVCIIAMSVGPLEQGRVCPLAPTKTGCARSQYGRGFRHTQP